MSLSERRITSQVSGRSPQAEPGQGSMRTVALVGAGVLVVAVILLVLPPMIATWVVLVGGILFLALVSPLALLCLVPFTVAFGSLFALTVHGINIGPTDVLVAVLALSWAVRSVAARRAQRLTPASRSLLRQTIALSWQRDRAAVVVFAALIVYLLVVLLSLAVATDRAAAAKEVVKWTEVLVLLALTLRYVRGAEQVRLVVWCLILAGVAEALLGCSQWVLALGSLGPGGASIRVFGTFGQPNPFGGYLNFALACALALVLFSSDTRERWVAGAASALLLITQALANSRGAELGILALLLTLLVVGWRRERLAGLVALVGAPLTVLAWVTHIIPLSVQEKLLAQVRLNDVAERPGQRREFLDG